MRSANSVCAPVGLRRAGSVRFAIPSSHSKETEENLINDRVIRCVE